MNPSTSTNEHARSPRRASLPEPIEAGAFWLAVLLPFCSLALFLGGLGTTSEYLLFGSLVSANVAALIVGHGYGR